MGIHWQGANQSQRRGHARPPSASRWLSHGEHTEECGSTWVCIQRDTATAASAEPPTRCKDNVQQTAKLSRVRARYASTRPRHVRHHLSLCIRLTIQMWPASRSVCDTSIRCARSMCTLDVHASISVTALRLNNVCRVPLRYRTFVSFNPLPPPGI